MQSPWDADDFMRRGFFGSLIGFRKRSASKSDSTTQQQPVQYPQQPAPRLFRQAPTVEVTPSEPTTSQPRTQYEIYREIVSEAEFIERSNTATPQSDFGSSPTSPTAPYPHHPPFLAPYPPQVHPTMPQNPSMIPSCSMPPQYPQEFDMPMAPPPYSNYIQQQANFEIKQEIVDPLVQSGYPIDKIVKIVISTLKESNLNAEGESPEEILKRKRIQNNMAAARYRKRQKTAKVVAEKELHELAKRNETLKDTVERMEREIAMIKSAVLTASKS